MLTKKTLGLVAVLTSLAAVGLAQTPPTPPAHHGIFSRIFHRPPHPGTPSTGMTRTGHLGMGSHGMTAIGGGIIGNKRTHVYHVQGDPGALPSPANRIYFRTEAQAEAAGYHRAGAGHGQPAGRMHGHRGSMTPMGAVPGR